MSIHIKSSARKYILLGIIIFILLGLFIASILAKKQDDTFETEQLLYGQALQLYEAGDYVGAQSVIADLTKERTDSEVVNYLGGLIEAQNGNYKAAATLMQKSLDLKPYKVEDPMFMLQFGEILLHAERYEDAKKVLERCKESKWEPEDYPEYQTHVQAMLNQIENT